MADWDYIECGFNAADETINFGARIVGEKDNLYETSTLASITNTQETSNQTPNIQASIKNESLFFTINKTIRVFEDLFCSNLSFSATFEDDIDTFCVTSDKKLLLGLRNGTVYCFNLKDGNVLIYEKSILENDNKNEACFVKAFVENEGDTMSFLVVLKNGQLYRITNSLNNASEPQQLDFICNLLRDLNCVVQEADFLNILALKVEDKMCIYDVGKDTFISDYVDGLRKMFLINTWSLLGLDDEGHLVQVCTKTLLSRRINHETLFRDIVLLYDEKSRMASHILGVNKDSFLKRLSFPDFTIIFSLSMSDEIHLIIPEHVHDSVIYISKVKEDDCVVELRFQTVVETTAENRLKRLLKRQKFNEAEQFAKLLNLDLTDIFKAQAEAIVNKVICNTEDVNNLLNNLSTMEDSHFKLKCCLDIHVTCDTLENVEKILSFGCSLLTLDSSQVVGDDEMEYVSTVISELVFRFNTFMSLVKCDEDENNVKNWVYFSDCDLIKHLNKTLEEKEMEKSIIIYNRLDSGTISNLNEDVIKTILEMLNNEPMVNKLQFLHTFIPLTLSYLPTSQGLFIKWIIEEVYIMEIRHLDDFPENAIVFIKTMTSLLKNDSYEINFQHQIPDIETEVRDLVEIIEKYQMLKTEYNIIFPFQHFVDHSETFWESILTAVIERTNSESILLSVVNKMLGNSNAKPDEILFTLVKNIIKYTEDYWVRIIPTILNTICSVQIKLEATLVILKLSSIPWCKQVHEIARKSLQYCHPLVKVIKHAIEYEPKLVVLKNSTYQLKKPYIKATQYFTFMVNRIIYCNLPTMVEDIYTLCRDAEEIHDADCLLIHHFIKKNEFERALKIIDEKTNEEKIMICKGVLSFVYDLLNNYYQSPELEQSYLGIIGTILQILQLQSITEFEKNNFQSQLDTIRSVYKIYNLFNLKIVPKNITDGNLKEQLVDNLISRVVEEFNTRKNTFNTIKQCQVIATCVKLDESFILLRLCEQLKDFNFTVNVAEKLSNDADSQSLCRIAVLILQHIGSRNEGRCMLKGFDNTQLNSFIKGLVLARKIMTRALLNSQRIESIQLANWIQSVWFLIKPKKQCDLSETYIFQYKLPTISTINSIKAVFDLYIKLLSGEDNLLCYTCSNKEDMQKLTNEQFAVEMQNLQSTVRSLSDIGHISTAYLLLKTLHSAYNPSITDDRKEQLNVIMAQTKKQQLQTVVAAQNIDTDLAFNLLFSYDAQYSVQFIFQCLKFYKRDITKFNQIARLRLWLLQCNDIADGQAMCRNIIYLAKWWRKIENCQIPYEQFFRVTPEHVIKNLIETTVIDINLINEFCSDFELDHQDYYGMYLRNLLVNWKPDYQIAENDYGPSQLTVNNGATLMENCMGVIDLIPNKDFVYNMVNNLWVTINFYHYEVFSCVLNILSQFNLNIDNNEKNYLLIFLINYNRISKPGKNEIEEWSQLCPNRHIIDDLSQWRLPFTPTLFTNEIHKIIIAEINLTTYSKWFEVASILPEHLSKDDICTSAIKTTVKSGVFNGNQSGDWIASPTHDGLLAEIELCAENISNLEKATSILYYLATNIPAGRDQLNAILLCYKYALKYRAEQPHSEDAQMAFNKIERKYFSYSKAFILHDNKLGDRCYLEMISRPLDELIEALYMDNRIVTRTSLNALNCPDINKATDELAQLHDLDIEAKRAALVTNWLSSDTITQDSILLFSAMHLDNNILRASYVCTSNDMSKWRVWLLQQGQLKKKKSKYWNLSCNALKCLCFISDVETIEELTGKTYSELRNTIHKLTLINSLEYFGFDLNIESLDALNKKGVINQLSHNLQNPISVKTIALICNIYEIDGCKYWKLIFNTMLKLNMLLEMKIYLGLFRTHLPFHNKKFYVDSWQAVINQPFCDMRTIEAEKLQQFCIKNFRLIQSCPVLFKLHLEYVTEKCLELKMYEFAALALQYLPKEKRNAHIKMILSSDKDIYGKINQLARDGFWGISFRDKKDEILTIGISAMQFCSSLIKFRILSVAAFYGGGYRVNLYYQ